MAEISFAVSQAAIVKPGLPAGKCVCTVERGRELERLPLEDFPRLHAGTRALEAALQVSNMGHPFPAVIPKSLRFSYAFCCLRQES